MIADNVFAEVVAYLEQALFLDEIIAQTSLTEPTVYACYYRWVNQDRNALRRYRTLQKHYRALNLKGWVCGCCGRSIPRDPNLWCLFDLHHIDQNLKTNKMSWHFSNSSWERIDSELDNV